MRETVIFYLNGQRQEAGPEDASMMLADYLRYRKALVGTKVVCAEGDCGACTVLSLVPEKGQYLPINSCITTVAQMDGRSLVSVDALAVRQASGAHSGLTPVQKAMVECHGSQCGFCTPGFVMALTGVVEKKLGSRSTGKKAIQPQEAKNALTGNLCRCTGYQSIIDAAVTIPVAKCSSVKDRFYSKAQEKDLKEATSNPVLLTGSEFSFHAPTSLKGAAGYLVKNPDVRMISAGTDLGVLHNKRKRQLRKTMSLHLIPVLGELKELGKGKVRVGAKVTLTELRLFLKKRAPEFARYLDIFASPQIKNVATLIGNVANASPIGDTPPPLLVLGAKVHAYGKAGKRVIPIDEFFLGYRKTALKPDEFIAAIDFDLPKDSDTLALYKVSQRKDLDISAVSAAFRLEWRAGKKKSLRAARVAMGGVAATPVRLKRTEAALLEAGASPKALTQAIEQIAGVLQSEISPISDVRGTGAFRRVLAENLLRKFLEEQVK